jgi:hypothetical protein
VLHRLGLEDCFQRIISFETLNSSKSNNINSTHNKDGSESKQSSAGIFDFYEYICRPNADIVLPKTPVVCKPFQDAFEKVFKMIDVDPHRTVRFYPSLIIYFLSICYVVKNQIMYYSFIYFAFCCSCSSMTVSVIYRQENP